MIMTRFVPVIAGVLAVAGCSTVVMAQNASGNADAFIKKWDRSGKGLIGLKEIDNAAIVKFEMLDKTHQGRLTTEDLKTLLGAEQFKEANPDNDATLGADEWFDLVKTRFYAANPDHDGSIDAGELKTPAGQALLKLVD